MTHPQSELFDLFRHLLASEMPSRETISRFQQAVWESADDDPAVDVLRDLAYDLDYFSEDPAADGSGYHGRERLQTESSDAARRLAALGVEIDTRGTR